MKFIELTTDLGNRYFNADHIIYFEVNQGNPTNSCWMYINTSPVSRILVMNSYRVMVEFLESKGAGVQ